MQYVDITAVTIFWTTRIGSYSFWLEGKANPYFVSEIRDGKSRQKSF